MDKRARSERPQRKRRDAKSPDAGSGEGAASALASLRALERTRSACAPVEEVQPPPAQPSGDDPQPGIS